MVKDIYLNRFNIRQKMKRDATVGVLGKRRQGKTTIMKNIAFELEFQRAIALCGSLGAKKGFLEFMAPRFVCSGSVPKLRDVVREHTKWVNKHSNIPLTEFETAIFIDDMAFSPQFMRSDELKELAMNGRQLGLFICISIQYMMEMTPSLRGNLDYIIMTKETSRQNREKIYKQYGGALPTMAAFDRILDACTRDYGVLVIDTTETSPELEKCMYHFRANADLPAWLLGTPKPAPIPLLETINENPENNAADECDNETDAEHVESNDQVESNEQDESTSHQAQNDELETDQEA